MKIYLVQHGQARSEAEDPARPLDELGLRQSELQASKMKGNISVSKIYCSKKLRAKQTAEIFAKQLGAKVCSVDGLKPMDDIQNAIKLIEDNVMFVGHLPFLERLSSFLLTNNQDSRIVKFSYSGVLCLEKEEKWRLVFYELP